MRPVYAKTSDTRLAGLERRVRFLERREQIPNPKTIADLGGGAAATFALTGGAFTITDGEQILDNDALVVGSVSFYGSDDATFDVNSSGRATFLRPGMYVIGCQMTVHPSSDYVADTYIQMALKYDLGSGGSSIEIPWFGGGTSFDEQILGTRFVYEAGTGASVDVGLQRLHPISLTSYSDFPLEIQPVFSTNDLSGVTFPYWLGLWGWRLGDPMDSTHSD